MTGTRFRHQSPSLASISGTSYGFDSCYGNVHFYL